jgi:hypothetical protein
VAVASSGTSNHYANEHRAINNMIQASRYVQRYAAACTFSGITAAALPASVLNMYMQGTKDFAY